MESRTGAEARILELCSVMNTRMSSIGTIAAQQEAQLQRLENASTAFAARLRVAGVRAGLQGFDDLLSRPAVRPDPPVPKVQQLDVSEMRVKPIVNREPMDHFRLPKPQPPNIVKRRTPRVPPVQQPVEPSKNVHHPVRSAEPSLLIDWSPLLPSSKRKLFAKDDTEVQQMQPGTSQARVEPPVIPPQPKNESQPKRPTRDDKSEQPGEQTSKTKDMDLSKFEKMQAAGIPQGAIEQAMRRDGVDPALLFSPGLSSTPGAAAAPPKIKPPAPPRRSSLEEFSASSTGSDAATKKPPPPPRRSSLGDDVSSSESNLTGKMPQPASGDQIEAAVEAKPVKNEDQEQQKRPPPIPKRTSTEDVATPDVQMDQETAAAEPPAKKSGAPPVPRRSSLNEADLSEKSKPAPPTIPRRSSMGEAETSGMPSAPPPPPSKNAPPAPSPTKVPEQNDTAGRAKSSGGLAARQAMLAGMLAGGGAPRPAVASEPPSVGESRGGGGRSSAMMPLPKEEMKAPKSLSDDAQLATAANELQKKLLGGMTSSKDLSKYQKMQKAGLPQGAIEHAMIKDGLDPKLLFG